MTKGLAGNFAVIYLNNKGLKLAEKILNFFPSAKVYKLNQVEIKDLWEEVPAIVFIMATGIVVRCIAPLIKDKKKDPGVLVIDEEGSHVIPLLGGHQGGANELAKTISYLINAKPVITTSSDLNNLPALDLWIERCQLLVKNDAHLPKIMSNFVENKKVKIYINSDAIHLPLYSEYFEVCTNSKEAHLVITNRKLEECEDKLILIPRNLILGVGLHDWITYDEIEEAVKGTFDEEGLYFEALKGVATIDRKANNPVLRDFCQKHKLELYSFKVEDLSKVESVSKSDIVEKRIGVSSVCEQSAIFASKGRLLVTKRVFKNLTIAVAESPYYVKGKIYVVGIGPGNMDLITPKAIKALREADIIIGYKTYIQQVEALIKDKKTFAYSMTEEVKRAKLAIDLALKGMIVAVVSGGDPGIYGMAGLILEIISQNNLNITVEIIPGVSAFNSASALVGAPIMNDFVCISLSDRLTPWEEIEKRLEHSAKADFVIVLYNPKSTKRTENLTKAKKIILNYRDGHTPVAIVKNANRNGQEIVLTILEDMDKYPVDMNTTLIIGNSQSFVYKNFLITPRGYKRKYEEEYRIIGSVVG